MKHMEFIGPCGFTLSTSERAGLQSSMLQRREEEALPELLFWGKVFGNENDYLVCHALCPPQPEDGEFPIRRYYFATSSDPTLRQFPVLSDAYKKLAQELPKGMRFKGDPSLPLDADPEEPEEEEEGKPPPERFRELHRLAYTVAQIDHDVAVTPKGALFLEPSRRVSARRGFEGLSHEAAGDLKNYFHFRTPETIAAAAALSRKGLIRDTDFLDPIAGDKPSGVWSLNYDGSNTQANLKSLAWPGYYFFAQIGGGEYGSVYFGNGLANLDLPFML